MEVLQNINVLAGLIALIAGLFVYAFLVPRNRDTFSPHIKDDAQDAAALRFISKIGAELYASLPASEKNENREFPRIEALLVRSGNPWGVSPQEFFFIQFVTAFLGFFFGLIAWFGLSFVMNLPAWLVIGGMTILGFMFPRLKHNDQAKKRDLDFKRQLPEALDLIIISLTGGNTFQQALRESLPNMQDGVLKEEFRNIIKSIDTGRTLNESLEHFAKRAPNESIRTFVQAVREANELNVPLVEVLQSRAEASRQEFFALIHAKTASLSPKMMGVLTPTLIPALLIILLTPALASLLNSLG